MAQPGVPDTAPGRDGTCECLCMYKHLTNDFLAPSRPLHKPSLFSPGPSRASRPLSSIFSCASPIFYATWLPFPFSQRICASDEASDQSTEERLGTWTTSVGTTRRKDCDKHPPLVDSHPDPDPYLTRTQTERYLASWSTAAQPTRLPTGPPSE